MLQLTLRLDSELCKCLISPLELVISRKISLGVVHNRYGLVKRDLYHLVSIVVESLKTVRSLFYIVTICVDQFSVHTVLFPGFSVL